MTTLHIPVWSMSLISSGYGKIIDSERFIETISCSFSDFLRIKNLFELSSFHEMIGKSRDKSGEKFSSERAPISVDFSIVRRAKTLPLLRIQRSEIFGSIWFFAFSMRAYAGVLSRERFPIFSSENSWILGRVYAFCSPIPSVIVSMISAVHGREICISYLTGGIGQRVHWVSQDWENLSALSASGKYLYERVPARWIDTGPPFGIVKVIVEVFFFKKYQ